MTTLRFSTQKDTYYKGMTIDWMNVDHLLPWWRRLARWFIRKCGSRPVTYVACVTHYDPDTRVATYKPVRKPRR